jgi:hypothetical protein
LHKKNKCDLKQKEAENKNVTENPREVREKAQKALN